VKDKELIVVLTVTLWQIVVYLIDTLIAQ